MSIVVLADTSYKTPVIPTCLKKLNINDLNAETLANSPKLLKVRNAYDYLTEDGKREVYLNVFKKFHTFFEYDRWDNTCKNKFFVDIRLRLNDSHDYGLRDFPSMFEKIIVFSTTTLLPFRIQSSNIFKLTYISNNTDNYSLDDSRLLNLFKNMLDYFNNVYFPAHFKSCPFRFIYDPNKIINGLNI